MSKPSSVLFALSILFAVLAGIVSVFQLNNLWLAGTQWMLVAVVFGIWAIYMAQIKPKE